MKHAIYGFLMLALVLQGCSISKSVRAQRNLISGTWNLTDVRYQNNTGAFQATLFDDADAICFEDSEWFFRDNNSTGRYTITQGSLCQGGDRFFRWSVIERPESYKPIFQFKFIDENRKDIGGGTGYRLNIESLTAETMQLSSNVQVDGAPITIVYTFNKK
ncbi:lipocalin family protein [Robiginitalea sp. M366]|uniref:lipocalin family protein n=1 Tax=Robiginitalea aestuariiviva TaxID=3036903 RepID=UPI00240CEBBA|nr:lipocalin family protein [Robiginitalea aestuariiviva]MDG1572892.1 lipocalin family protein [Robiginitalea aestuariiviva]